MTVAVLNSNDTHQVRELIGMLCSEINQEEYKDVPSFVKNDLLLFVMKSSSVVEGIEAHSDKAVVQIKDGSKILFGAYEDKPQRIGFFKTIRGNISPVINDDGDMVISKKDADIMPITTKKLINTLGGVEVHKHHLVISGFGRKQSGLMPITTDENW